MKDLQERNNKRTGFIDPYVVYKTPKDVDPDNLKPVEIERNIRRFLYNQRDKEYILFPYNMG